MTDIQHIIDINVHAPFPFSVCLMNPPYNKANTFLAHIIPMSSTCVSIQPTAWLFGKHKNMKIVSQIQSCRCDIDIVDPSQFDAGFLANVAITHIDTTQPKQVNVINNITNTKRTYDDIMDVDGIDDVMSKFSNIVRPLYEEDNMQNHIRRNYGKFLTQNASLTLKHLPIVRISVIRGSVDQRTGTPNADFYTLISNNELEVNTKTINFTDRLNDTNGSGRLITKMFILCSDTREQHNIVRYMQTDFCRACLRIIKTNGHLDRGELKYIPWFDFSDEHFSKTPREIDDYLFNKYNIPDSIRTYIESILPDYYNIR